MTTKTKDLDARRMAATRLAAVQAVYEQDMVDADLDDILSGFGSGRWTAADDEHDAELAKPRPGVFETLVRGVNEHSERIDTALAAELSIDASLSDIESVVRAIARTGCYELLERKTVPARTVITAYTGVADAFFDDDGPQVKLIAGLLNGVARTVRPDEFTMPETAVE